MRRVASAATVISLTLLIGGCGGSGGEAAPATFTGISPELQDPGPVHVHGLGYDQQHKVLYLATHTGMFELPADAAKAMRIGDSQPGHDGFTLVRPDLFLGSHPDAREQFPPYLGLISSSDRARSWRPISLLGEADFHVLRARGTTVYGFDSGNQRLLASKDAGETWKKLPAPEALLDLAIDPSDPEHLLASGGAVLYRSQDGGRSWHALASGIAGYLAWPSTRRPSVGTLDGSFMTAEGATGSRRRIGSLGAPPAALLAVDERTFFAALHDGVIKQSSDGGVTWKARATP